MRDSQSQSAAPRAPLLRAVRRAGLPYASPLLLIVGLALALRVLLWGALPRTGLISDEGEYLSAATWLAEGRGFDWYQGYLWTRAPLYPLLVALHLRLFGRAVEPVYLTQTALSLLNVALVYALAGRLAGGRRPYRSLVPGIAAALMAIYLPFATYAQTLLSETVYMTLLLGGFLALSYVPAPAPAQGEGKMRGRRVFSRASMALIAGLLLGLATLTRSLTLGFLPLVALWLLLRRPAAADGRQTTDDRRRSVVDSWWSSAAAFTLAAALVILPWSLYSSRVYGGPVLVDTSGAFNLLLGARTAFEGRREDAWTRDFVLGLLGRPGAAEQLDTCAPYPGALPSQAARQAAMTAEGLCLIAARPLAFAQKSLAELIDLFQINYTGAERFTDGFSTGRLPPWYVLALFALDDTLYVLTLPLATVGWALARRSADSQTRASAGLAGLWWLYNLGAAPLLFAINRFRLPLLPFAFIFAAWAIAVIAARRASLPRAGGDDAGEAGSPAPSPPRRGGSPHLWLCGALALLLFLVAATPYAYLEPRAPGADSRWASYLGPYPSSLAITGIALAARPAHLANEQFGEALRAGDLALAERLLASGALGGDAARLGPALLAARQGRYEDALAALPAPEAIARSRDALAGVVRGDALRSMGDEAGARAAFTPEYVDSANPVEWSWRWLHPIATRRVDLGGNLDLGYVSGCYLGEGDASLTPPATFRWCTDGARIRFPGAGSSSQQTLALRVDGRGWRGYGPPPSVQIFLDERLIGAFVLSVDGVGVFTVLLPPGAPGEDVVITLRTATFVPDAARYLSQQGEPVVGQVQRLGLRLDWAELREAQE